MEHPIQVYVKDRELVNLPRPSVTPMVRAWKYPSASVVETEPSDDQESLVGSPIGACSFSHEILMLLTMKQQLLGEEQFRFVVHLVRTSKLPPVFHEQALHHVPALVDLNTGMATDHLLDILQYLDTQYPTVALVPIFASEQAMLRSENACYEVFQSFYFVIKRVAKDNKKIHAAMKSLNACLLANSEVASFTTNKELTNFDTEVMPLLHQIRVATMHLTSYHIPHNFSGIWNYLSRAYDSQPFVDWCPSDQEIVFAWKNVVANIQVHGGKIQALEKQVSKLKLSKDKLRLLKAEPAFSFSVPSTE